MAGRRSRVVDHRVARFRRLLPRGVGHRAVLRTLRHLLPRPRQRGQQCCVLLARRHQGRRGVTRSALRAVLVARTRRATRHRPRHRERSARRSHPVRLRTLRAASHGPGRQRDHLSRPLGRTRHGACTRLRARTAGRLVEADRSLGTGAEGGRADRSRRTARSQHSDRRSRVGVTCRGHAAPSRHPFGWNGDLRSSGDRSVSGRVGHHARSQRVAVGQGRLCSGRTREVRSARTRHAVGSARCSRSRTRSRRNRTRSGHASAGRRRVRHVVPSRHRRRVPDRVARADGHLAATQTAPFLRPGGRGRAHPPRTHPGRLGASLHPSTQRPGADHLSASSAREQSRQDAGNSLVPGAAHADGDRRRRLHTVGGRSITSGHGFEAQCRAHAASTRSLVRRYGRARYHRSDRRRDLRQDGRLRQLRIPRESLGVVRLSRVFVVVVEVASSGGVLRRFAERAADGFLESALARPGRSTTRGRGPHSRSRGVRCRSHTRTLRRKPRTLRRTSRSRRGAWYRLRTGHVDRRRAPTQRLVHVDRRSRSTCSVDHAGSCGSSVDSRSLHRLFGRRSS